MFLAVGRGSLFFIPDVGPRTQIAKFRDARFQSNRFFAVRSILLRFRTQGGNLWECSWAFGGGVDGDRMYSMEVLMGVLMGVFMGC